MIRLDNKLTDYHSKIFAMKKVFGALFFGIAWLFVSGADAANWYVRPTSSGSNNGTDWNNAWTANTISWASISPGDTIWMAGGAYTTQLAPNKSGSAGNYIYIKRVLATDSVPVAAAGWNSAFDSQVIVHPIAQIPALWGNGSAGSYVYIDGRISGGIKFQVDADVTYYAGAIHITGTGGQNNIVLTNLDLAGPAPDGNPYPRTIYDCSLSIKVSNTRAHDILVTHCLLHGSADVVLVQNCDNLTIEYSQLYDNCVSGAPHANVFEFSYYNNFVLRYCTLYNWQIEGFRPYAQAGATYIYGNIWHSPLTISGVARVLEADGAVTQTIGPFYIYNNTFVNITYAIYGVNPSTVTYNSASQARNNIYWNCGSTTPPFNDNGYNYGSSSTSGTGSINGSGQTPFVSLSAKDYHIVSNISSVLPRNKGAALTSPFDIDLGGNIRGADGAWDIGAYEFNGGVSTNPVISVSPGSLNFGTIATNTTANSTLTVKNAGGGTLAGVATVALPFSIVSGGTYNLGSGQNQAITISFSPTVGGNASQTVSLTGGGGASVTVNGVATVGTNPVPLVSAISMNASDVASGIAGIQIYGGSVVQFSATATNALTYQWSYAVNGGSPVIYQSGSGAVPVANFTYGTNTIGNTYVWTLVVSNGQMSAQSQLTLSVVAPPAVMGGLSFAAQSGQITSPFTNGKTVVNGVTNNYIYQSVETTGVANGGSALYNFTVTNAGNYVIQASINAPNIGANSLYVNIDAQPQDPTMIWDVTLTSGFEQRLISWRGTGTDAADQFVPKIFTLSEGTHQLIIIGREANTQLQSLSILLMPAPPQNLHVVSP
jgi:hypothetical protein